jgi:hypothetical protein
MNPAITCMHSDIQTLFILSVLVDSHPMALLPRRIERNEAQRWELSRENNSPPHASLFVKIMANGGREQWEV